MSTQFRQIGKGFCGSVWATDRPGEASAMKREDGGDGRSVAKDSAMHLTIQSSLIACQSHLGLAARLNIPQHRQYISREDTQWWHHRASRFPTAFSHTNTLITERILPLPQSARHNLIDSFCLETSRQTIKNSRKDDDCLARCYLGRRRKAFSCPSKFFTLRNKPLTVNQQEGLGLPIDEYALTMADALAVLFWHAKTEANDVEFVLAPPRQGEAAFQSDVLGPHRLWILDFDCVNPITMDEVGVEQAASAFFRNDPFYPRPDYECEVDERLWELFSKRFLESSTLILGDERLPRMMVECLVRKGEERKRMARELQTAERVEGLAL